MDALDADSDDEFGYSFTADEELQLIQLTEASARPSHEPAAASAGADVIDSIPDHWGEGVGHGSHEPVRRTLTPSLGGRVAMAFDERPPSAAAVWSERQRPAPAPSDEDVSYPDLSRALSELDDVDAAPSRLDSHGQPEAAGHRCSPLQRFRTFPRKPLSVSDLTSGAWCELQYWYTLTRLPGGRRTRTPAMRQGSKLHRKLEDQVHTRVKVDVATKEDGFALRLWNLVQGLRTLRETGLTRELEVWGLVDGHVVNGIIDGLSHDHPNPEFEEELSSQEADPDTSQSVLTDYFPPKKRAGAGPKVYLTDVKTRGSLAPVSKSMLRPAKIQLLLYHRLLAAMASGRLDFFALLARYGLRPDKQLSDAFLAQIGQLHEDEFFDAPSSPVGPAAGRAGDSDSDGSDAAAAASDDSINYGSLRRIIPLVLREMELAFPDGRDSLGHMLRVQYVHREDGRQLDVHDFPVSRQALDDYLDGYMAWWRGDREARGVDIEEAFKCRSCDFAADCSWRQSMDDGHRRRRAASRAAAGGRG
ncbi:hypothetical protein CDD83_9680 [Cordyceps sp. RAO-2017]|nr:hypothetical protein CDD83_9680 [Cordyceps sp. RAO-2017]